MATSQDNRICTITTNLGKDKLLIHRMVGFEGVSQLFSFNAELLSINDSIDFKSLIGTGVTITLELANGALRYFNGIVSRCTQGNAVKHFVSYQIEIVPWFWLLTKRMDCRIFQQKSTPDIIEEIFDSLDLKDYDFKLSGTYDKRDYCVQYRETDFQFISRLLEDEGIYYFFTHEDGRHVLVFGDATNVHPVGPDQKKAIYAGSTEDPQEEEYIRDFQIEQVLHPGKYSLSDYNFETPSLSLLVNIASKIDIGGNKKLELYDYNPGKYGNVDKGEAFAKLRMEEQEVKASYINGQSNCRFFAAGGKFDLAGHYRDDFNTAYTLTYVEHSISQAAGYRSGDTTDSIYENRFKCIPNSTLIRPCRTTPNPKIAGPQTAAVVGPSGEEIHTDKYGRVKVKFHWDRNSEADDKSSCWVRIAENWAGKNFGTIFLPRVGQEVIVEFLEGDPDRPIITGRVYNAQQMPPYTLPDEKTKSAIKTSTSKGGGGSNELRFDDKKGKEQIFLHAEKDIETRIKNDDIKVVEKDLHLTVSGDQKVLFKGDKNLTVSGDQNEKADGAISIETGSDLLEKAANNLGVEAGNEIHLKAGMKMILEADMGLTIKVGGSFVVIDSKGVSISGPMVNINSGGSAGSGSGCTPQPPEEPKDAIESTSGDPEKPPKPTSYGPTAITLKQASRSGAPFCERCEEAKKKNK